MADHDLQMRTKRFALRVLKIIEAMPRSRSGNIIAGQLGRSGTSVGANYRAACRARSQKEFVAKLGVVEEEADESAFWLELTIKGGLLDQSAISPLLQEANELTAIMVASRRTARRNL